MRTPTMGARAFIPMALAGAVLFTLAPSIAAPVSAAEPKPTTEAQQIISIARKQLGDPWRYGRTGPRAFDCSGLVVYSFRKAGDSKLVAHGRLRSARALYHWYAKRGLASRSNPKPGDLVIWGRGTHVGIYIGNGKAISTLTSGVRIHRVHAVRARFTAYLHTGMWKQLAHPATSATAPAATPTPTPTTDVAAPTPTTDVAAPTTDPAAPVAATTADVATTGSAPTATTTATAAAITTTTVTATAPKAIRHTRVVANLRTGPGITRHRIATLRDGTRLIVLRSARDSHGRIWLEVKTGSRTGWVASWLTTRH